MPAKPPHLYGVSSRPNSENLSPITVTDATGNVTVPQKSILFQLTENKQYSAVKHLTVFREK